MSGKKYDNKGRLLRQGERQREDGRYEYRYIDVAGKTRSIYSWRLVDTDKAPFGRSSPVSLREMEKQARRDVEDGVKSYTAVRTTLNDFYESYMETKGRLKSSTRENYKYLYKKYVRDELGNRKIGAIKNSDIKKFYAHLIDEHGFAPNSMEIIHTILHPVFKQAVLDGYIRTNPKDEVMRDIKSSYDWQKKKRHALTKEQQSAFISFIAASKVYKHWLPLFTVLLGTGGRIGEIVGLRWQDCDFDKGIININHSLIYRKSENGTCCFQVTTPKTKAGVRQIPMLSEVRNALREEQLYQMRTGFNDTKIDGFSGFIFRNRYGDCLSPHCVNRAIERISRDYNAAETKLAEQEKRVAVLLPHFSAHHLRHTFCTRFCENETNLKIIQEIMGHADITTTMDVNNEATADEKARSFANLEGKIKIS